MLITIDGDGRIFFDVDGKQTRSNILQKMGDRYKVQFTPDELKRFSVLSSFGVPMTNMKQLLNAKEGERASINKQTKGIPSDSLQNELADWINYARHANPKYRIAIKGDGQANYPVVKRVIQTLQEQKVNKFNLITNLEEAPKN
jgi:biopolymer transport protein ExbD